MSFKSSSVEDRLKESLRIRNKYPTRIPVIIENHKSSTLKDLDSSKFLVPVEITVGHFLYIIRRRMILSPEECIFIFFGKDCVSPPVSEGMLAIYNKYKDEDGFLYASICNQMTFGL